MSKSRAFTMVELIFVIVILGILSAVAVPKINASRDDARFAVLTTSFKRRRKKYKLMLRLTE